MNLNISTENSKFITENKLDVNQLIDLGRTIIKLGLEYKLSEDEPIDNRFDTILSELKDLHIKLGGSAKKGQISEDIIWENLVKHFPDAEIIDSRYETSAGDLIVKIGNYTFMIEIKNYKCNVPTKEIKKFIANLADNEYDAGLLVSCSSGIVHCKSSMDYEIIGKSIALQLPMAGMDGISIVWGIRFCVKVLDVLREMNKSDQTELLMTHIRTKMSLFNTILEENQKLRDSVKKMRINIIATVDNSTTALNHSIDQNSGRMKNIIESFDTFIKTGKMETDVGIFRSTKKPLHEFTMVELRSMAKEKKIKGFSSMKKQELIDALK